MFKDLIIKCSNQKHDDEVKLICFNDHVKKKDYILCYPIGMKFIPSLTSI
ncbi:unnamed protein product [Paramecium sonneborni]|uniref:Uncharacterized protein n=1 Tax=Paramecium sonneborni TaxID=65129 RepID=A0A8S1RUI4_9CILI|nr:unnamed protein product [Paramecium sonneborni]